MPSAAGPVSRLARYGLLVLLGGTTGCSALLDWKGYSNGGASDVEAGSIGDDSGDTGASEAGPVEGASSGGTIPKCSSGNCKGCCNAAGQCVGGQSTATCGTGGATCIDCSSTNLICSGGACAPPTMVEAGPPPACDVSTCIACIPVYQKGCCKSDGTCGCAGDIAPITPCM